MKCLLVLLLFAGVVLGNLVDFEGWNPNQEFLYHFESQILTGIPQIKESQLAGLQFSSKVRVQSQENSSLKIRFEEIQLSTFNSENVQLNQNGRLTKDNPEVKNSLIPQKIGGQLEKPFLVHLKDGLVERFFVDNDEANFISNIRRSFLSQIQLDLSRASSFDDFSLFENREDSIVGNCHTDYSISPISESESVQLQTEWDEERKQVSGKTLTKSYGQRDSLCKGKANYMIRKETDLMRCLKRPIFQQWVGLESKCEGTSCEKLFAQSSFSQCYICGNQNNYVIRKCQATHKMLGAPLARNTKEKLDGTSVVTIELLDKKDNNLSSIRLPSNLKEKISLIYEFEQNSSNKHFLRYPDLTSALAVNPFALEFDTEEIMKQTVLILKKVIKNKDNNSDQAKYLSYIAKLLRVLSHNDLLTIETHLLPATDSLSEVSVLDMKSLFYNLLSTVGTNPAVIMIKQSIKSGMLFGEIASQPLAAMFRSVKTPTKELLTELVEFTKTLKRLESDSKDLHNIALGEMSHLLHRACIHPTRSNKEFPVKVYGRFCAQNSELIVRNWIPYLERELHGALKVEAPNEKAALILLNSLGKLGHRRGLKTITKIIDDSYRTSPMLRAFAVYSLKQVSLLNPEMTRQILMSIIGNPTEDNQVRFAAISSLPWSQPANADLLRLASQSWHEPSDEINCHIHNMINSLSKTEKPEFKSTRLNAPFALKIMKPCIAKSRSNQIEVFLKKLKLVLGLDDLKWIFNEEENFPTQFSISELIDNNFFLGDGFTSLLLTQGLDDLYYRLSHHIKTDSSASGTVRQALEILNQELDIKQVQSTLPQLLLKLDALGHEQIITLKKEDLLKLSKSFVHKLTSGRSNFSSSHFSLEAEVEVFEPSISGFLMFAEVILPLYYTYNGTLNAHHMKKFGGSLEASVNANLQTSLGVICPLTQEYVGSGIDSGISLSLPALQANLETRDQDHISLEIKRQRKEGEEDQVEQLVHSYMNPFTRKKDVRSLSQSNWVEEFREVKHGIHLAQSGVVSDLGLGFKMIQESDSPLDHSWNPNPENQGTDFLSSLWPSSIRKSSRVLQWSSRQSQLEEICISFNSYTKHQPLEPQIQQVSDETRVAKICKENFPRSLLEFNHCLHFLSNLEEMAAEARTNCHRKSFPNESSRLQCHKTADICEGALNTCFKPHGPRARSCHNKYGACKARFSHENKLDKAPGLQQFKVTKSELLLSIIGQNLTENLQVELTHSSNSQVGNNNKEFNATINLNSYKSFDSKDSLISLDIQTLVPFQLSPISSLVEENFWLKFNVAMLQRNITLIGVLEKTDELKAAIKNTPEYSICLIQDLADHPNCGWIADKATAMDKLSAIFYKDKQFIPILPAMISTFMQNLFRKNSFGNSLSDSGSVFLSVQSDLYGSTVNVTAGNINFNVSTDKLPIPQVLKGAIPISLQFLTGESHHEHGSVPDADICSVATNSIATFHADEYDYVLNDCMHLLFKDCSAQLPFAVLAKRSLDPQSSQEFLTLQILAGPIAVILEPEWINGSKKMNIVINVDDLAKALILTPEQFNQGQIHIEQNKNTGEDLLQIFTRNNTMFSMWFYKEQIEVTTNGLVVQILIPPTLSKHACGLCGNSKSGLKSPQMCSTENMTLLGYSYMLDQGLIIPNANRNCSGIPIQDQNDFSNFKHDCFQSTIFLNKNIYSKKQVESKSSSIKHDIMKKEEGTCISKKPIQTCLAQKENEKLKSVGVEYSCFSDASLKAYQLEELASDGDNIENDLKDYPTDERKTKYIADQCHNNTALLQKDSISACDPPSCCFWPSCCCCKFLCATCGQWCFGRITISVPSALRSHCSNFLAFELMNPVNGSYQVETISNCTDRLNLLQGKTAWDLKPASHGAVKIAAHSNEFLFVLENTHEVFTTSAPNLDVTSAEWIFSKQESGRFTIKNVKNLELLYLNSNNRVLTAPQGDIPTSGLYQWNVQAEEVDTRNKKVLKLNVRSSEVISASNSEIQNSGQVEKGQRVPSCAQIDEMKEALFQILGDGDLIPDAVRLGFHTCVGGCNGCINWNEPANRGLQKIVDLLERAYLDLELQRSGISRADFWALAATVSIELATASNRKNSLREPCLHYYWGRKDCSTSPITNRRPEFPRGDMNSEKMFDYFLKMFDLPRNETVTLMGVHSLGEAKHANGGYNGVFTPRHKEILNTTYYANMLDPNFKWVNTNAGQLDGQEHWQWTANDSLGDEHLRLNTDFEILFRLILDENGKNKCILDTSCARKRTCGTNNICSKSQFYNQVQGYIQNPESFYTDFRQVYTRALQVKSRNLEVSGGTCLSCSDKDQRTKNGEFIQSTKMTPWTDERLSNIIVQDSNLDQIHQPNRNQIQSQVSDNVENQIDPQNHNQNQSKAYNQSQNLVNDVTSTEPKQGSRKGSEPAIQKRVQQKVVPSCSQISQMKEAVLQILGDGDLIPDAVRFSFHSCIGGCNGCLNWNEPANRGLRNFFDQIEETYLQLELKSSGISRADFWALAGSVSIEAATAFNRGNLTSEPCLQYYWGREDCATSPNTNRKPEFPRGDITFDSMVQYFNRMFNLTKEETVTLMGVHSLGEAKLENGGYHGVFTPRHKEILNVTYYANMLDKSFNWTNKNAGKLGGFEHWQWNANDSVGAEHLRLNTDLEIFFNLDLDLEGKTRCILDTSCAESNTCGKNNICPKYQTYKQARSYIQNPETFYADFRRVFTKSLQVGSSNLNISGGTCYTCEDRQPIENKIRKNGYPVEAYTVTTEDCYILEIHRIPYGKKSPRVIGQKRPVVFLQHGLFCSSDDWVFSSPDKSLAYILADNGYDVWMGNYRGNFFSRKHCTLDPSQSEFWNFSWDEMGTYDLPAMINKTLQVSGQERLFYIGHSMGTTGFLVFANTHPEMQSKIILANLMAPVAYVEHMRSPIRYLTSLTRILGGEFMPNNAVMKWLASFSCQETRIPLIRICKCSGFVICGLNLAQTNETLLVNLAQHSGRGVSSLTLYHYAQMVSSGQFCALDNGALANFKKYGQPKPPQYSLDVVKVPVATYWSKNDMLAEPIDVRRLTSTLPNVVSDFLVPFDQWSHQDFIYGIDAYKLVYPEILKNMDKFRPTPKNNLTI